jgi:hypothetical protein
MAKFISSCWWHLAEIRRPFCQTLRLYEMQNLKRISSVCVCVTWIGSSVLVWGSGLVRTPTVPGAYQHNAARRTGRPRLGQPCKGELLNAYLVRK